MLTHHPASNSGKELDGTKCFFQGATHGTLAVVVKRARISEHITSCGARRAGQVWDGGQTYSWIERAAAKTDQHQHHAFTDEGMTRSRSASSISRRCLDCLAKPVFTLVIADHCKTRLKKHIMIYRHFVRGHKTTVST